MTSPGRERRRAALYRPVSAAVPTTAMRLSRPASSQSRASSHPDQRAITARLIFAPRDGPVLGGDHRAPGRNRHLRETGNQYREGVATSNVKIDQGHNKPEVEMSNSASRALKLSAPRGAHIIWFCSVAANPTSA